jgi:hypothetical protein
MAYIPVSRLSPEQLQKRREQYKRYRKNVLDYRNEYQRILYSKNPNKKQKSASQYQQRREHRPWLQLKINAARRAKQAGIQFNLTADYIESIWTDTCPILGIPLFHSTVKGKACDNSHSIDRIDSSKGYVVGNVAIISYKANVIKNNGTSQEHRLIAEWMDKHSLTAGDSTE